MVYQRYCYDCGYELSLNDKECPDCGQKVLINPNDNILFFNPPVHTIGFFNFNIDFSPYIKSNRTDYDYYLCKCGFLNEIDNEFCLNCGEKRTKSKFKKIIGLFLSKSEEINTTITCDCGEVNSADNKFCEFCGKSLIEKEETPSQKDVRYENFNFNHEYPVFCYCGFENDIDDSFCLNCGFPLKSVEKKSKGLEILCTCGTFNDINNKFCEKCGINLDKENEVLICACGKQNKVNEKFCSECERQLNHQRNIKTKIVCRCGTILDYSTAYCFTCGKDI